MMNKQTVNDNLQTVSFLIVGQGLAGTLLSWELHRRGVSFAVVDEGLPVTSSKIAAGMFNPINTKRFTVTADAESAFADALNIYRSMETALGISIVHLQNIYNVFGNVKEGNDYSLKTDHPFFKQYTIGNPVPEEHVIQPYGAFEVGMSGWIDMKLMLDTVRKFIATEYCLMENVFDYDLLMHNGARWTYKGLNALQVVFCEGYKGNRNPFFKDMHIVPCKGDILEFDAQGFSPKRVVKKGIYIVPMGNGRFRAGSSYKWHNDDERLHDQDKEELMQKITELIDVPFTVISHKTAIRPTTRTRETFIKTHSRHPTLHAINGLGTKGVINGVAFVQKFLAQQHLYI